METQRDYTKCPVCKDYHWTDKVCAPIFQVHHDEYSDDPFEVRAWTFDDAAIKYAAHFNQDDYPLMNGSEETIKVTDSNGSEKWFIISAEPTIHYNSLEIENPNRKELVADEDLPF